MWKHYLFLQELGKIIKILNLAEENKVKITTDVEFFNEISNVKIIGVTGT